MSGRRRRIVMGREIHQEALMLETRWHIVRHAPVDNPLGRIYGASDKPANTSDTAAFEALARHLPAGAVTVTSHLQRTHQTLDAIRAAGLELPKPVIDERLGEQDFGDWVGLTYEEVRSAYGDAYNRFWLAPVTERAPNGESFQDLLTRARASIEALTEQFAGRDIICVAHGGTIRAALAIALGIDPEKAIPFATDNLSTTMIDWLHPEPGFEGGWRVRGTNVQAR
jgi:broad specificity phosphatase PhoE